MNAIPHVNVKDKTHDKVNDKDIKYYSIKINVIVIYGDRSKYQF